MTVHLSRGLLDTSALMDLGSLDPQVLPQECFISAVTLAERSVGPLLASTDTERMVRQTHLQLAEADFDPIPFAASCARAFALVASSLRKNGRKPKARSYDAMIAATAIANDLPLDTFNIIDFSGIDS